MPKLLEQTADLLQLAAGQPGPYGRRLDDIFLAVTELFEHQSGAFSPRERTLATDILRRLSKDVEMSLRIGLAERLADRNDAPHELILLLADDRIEVSRLILARSPVLSESDLIHILEVGTTDHHVSVAERPAIGETVSAALARSECEAVVIALLRNTTAKIGGETFGTLIERARHIESLQEPLVARSDIPPVLASRMYVWVSGALKTALSQRYPHVAESLSVALDEQTVSLQSGQSGSTELGASKLIAKLAVSGQLRSSFLIRVLHQGQMELFEHGFAALLQADVELVRRGLYSGRASLLALACRAVGIDRSVFMTVFNLSRHHRQAPRLMTDADQADVQEVFVSVSKADALAKFKAAIALAA